MLKGPSRVIHLLALLLCIVATGAGQEDAGQGLSELLRGNERFGRKLLQHVHAGSPDGNVVVSPVSVSVIFLALQVNSAQERTHKEIGNAFGWGSYPHLRLPARMLLAAFQEPERRPPPRRAGRITPQVGHSSQETAWITNTILYRSSDAKVPLSEDFVASAKEYFGIKLVNAGMTPPTAADLQRARGSLGAVPKVSPKNDLWISSGVHLQTAWRGNTFSMSQPRPGEFRTGAGQSKQVAMLDSELATFLYAQTGSFQAVALPCNIGYMLAVLPAPGKDIHDLERELAEQPEALDAALRRQTGFVTMPVFRVRFESDLRPAIKAMGITQVFEDLGSIIRIPGSHLTEVVQNIDIEINRDGIRADAETIAGVVLGGIHVGPNPFHVELNRPFIFLVRDQTTNALLFLGVVMDPSQN